MNLTTLIFHIRNHDNFLSLLSLDVKLDIDEVDVFMENKLEIQSMLIFFDVEEVHSNKIEINGIEYIELLPLNMIVDAVNSYKADDLDDVEIANKILSYRINNA